jgi:DNA ligase-1
MSKKVEKAVLESLPKLPPSPTVAPEAVADAAHADGNFPILYSKSKGGKTQVWSIKVMKGPGEGATIKTSYGYEGGAMQEGQKEILKGKVKRSPWEQALSEAQSDWKKKKDKGYAENLGNAHVPGLAGEDAVAAHATILPMLAHDYHKRGKSIVFPCYVQAKLDGVRSIFKNGVLTSRMGKPFSGLEHILAELGPATTEGLVLDGEVYSTTLPFQQFVGLVKKKKFTAEDKEQLKQVNLWVYDCVNDSPFEQRLATLKAFFAKHKFGHVHLLPTEEAANAGELKGFHDGYVAKGYEGLIVRNKKGMYHLATRSADLQKYKEFEDDEYEVVGFTDGEGQEKGLVIWTCKTKGGKQFHVRPRGTHEERAALFKEGDTYVGKKLTVRYQELTGDGIPRFPVGISFRDYE